MTGFTFRFREWLRRSDKAEIKSRQTGGVTPACSGGQASDKRMSVNRYAACA